MAVLESPDQVAIDAVQETPAAPGIAALVPGIGAFAAVTSIGAAQGGYFPTAWGWSGAALALTACVALLVRERPTLGRLELAMVAGLVALTGWIALSTLWSTAAPRSMLEAERSLIYLAGVLAALVLVRRRSVPLLLGGVLAGVTAVSGYALATRLFPTAVGRFDAFGAYRLAEPLGYWNALGIFSVLGILLAIGFAARSPLPAARALAAAALVVLLPTLYFTYSRGAWLALAVGLAVTFLLDRQRLRLVTTLLVVAAAPAAAVWIGSRSVGLTNLTATVGQANHDGRRLALALVALAAASATLTVGLAALERRIRPARRARVAYASALAAVSVAGLVLVVVHFGGPAALARKGYDAFTAPRPGQVEGNLNTRLFSLSSNGRIQLWHAAWRDYTEHPLLGSGAGSFGQYWLSHRTSGEYVQDAHNLYVEQLAELGVGGLGLVVLVLLLPLAAALRSRSAGLVAPVAGAYVAFLLHAAGDWDWEMPAVTLTALLLGASLLVYGGRRPDRRPLSTLARSGLLAVALAAGSFAFVAAIGNGALSASRSAADAADWHKAETQARKAIGWAPWSDSAWQALGDAQVGAGDLAAARGSYGRAVAKNPRDWSNWYALASVSSGSAQRSAYAEALRLNPHDPSFVPIRNLGLLPK